MTERRFIEESFPITEVGDASAKEKNTIPGNIGTLHTWWARRPTATSRATNFASLIRFPASEIEQKNIRDNIIKLSQWTPKKDVGILKVCATKTIKENGHIPKVLDPFSGGGSIPLESLRLGCETYACDYNPVANIILKCTLEYPQKFSTSTDDSLVTTTKENKLVNDLKKYGDWVFSEVKNDIKIFYKADSSGEEIDGYIWSKTVPCQNPQCRIEIPLMRRYWLTNKEKRRIALFPISSRSGINFKIVGDGFEKLPKTFDPNKGSISKAIVTCQKCGSTIDAKTTKKLFAENPENERLIAIIFHNKIKGKGRFYRLATATDIKNVVNAKKRLEKKIPTLEEKWKISPIPDESLPPKGTLGFRIQNYNLKTWGDLFNPRQKLSLITFVEKIREVHDLIAKEHDKEYAKIISTYLALTLDRVVMSTNRFTFWRADSETVMPMFSNQTVSMVWDYTEPNTFSSIGRRWESLFLDTLEIIINCGKNCVSPATVEQSSATSLSYEDSYFDAVITDPPYYDNVPYSHLADFFYVWLKRSIGHLYPGLFSTPLTPKTNEVVAYSNTPGGWDSGKKHFETNLRKSFQEIHRVLKPDGIAVIVYAHKSTAGWETLIKSLLDSGLVITGSWPLRTERISRSRGQGSAALASSIYMIMRKWEKKPIGFYSDVKKEMKNYLDKKLGQLWSEDIRGADFLVAAIGSAIEVFGRYERVLDDGDNPVKIIDMLDDTREMATNYAIHQVMHNGFADQISPMTRFYVLWRWAYGESKIPYDDALRLSQSAGMDLNRELGRGFIVKNQEFVRVLGPDERGENIESDELIDILHLAVLRWKNKEYDSMGELLKEKGYDRSDTFRMVGQAISESLQQDSKEKKWLDGFLAGLSVDDPGTATQTKLF